MDVQSKVSILWLNNDTIIAYRNYFGILITIEINDNSITIR